MITTIKTCFKCDVAKPLDQFYKHAGMKDGLLGKCKDCTKADSTARRELKIDEVRAYDRARGSRQSLEYLKSYRSKNPKKYKAHCIVNNALRDGKISKLPCEVCSNSKSVAHHDDYNKPLDIRWLCQAHHKQWHRDNGEGIT